MFDAKQVILLHMAEDVARQHSLIRCDTKCTVKIIVLFILGMFAHFHVYVKLRAKDQIVGM